MDKLMKVFGSLLPKIAKKLILSKKDKILTEMNKKLDIPFADEEDERKILEGIWATLEEALDAAIK